MKLFRPRREEVKWHIVVVVLRDPAVRALAQLCIAALLFGAAPVAEQCLAAVRRLYGS